MEVIFAALPRALNPGRERKINRDKLSFVALQFNTESTSRAIKFCLDGKKRTSGLLSNRINLVSLESSFKAESNEIKFVLLF